MNLNFDELYKLPILNMKFNGTNPYKRKNIKWFLPFFCMHGLTTLTCYFLIYSTIFYDMKTNMTQACASSTLIVVYFVISTIYFFVIKHQDLLKSLIDKVKEDYETANNQMQPEEKVLVAYFATKGRKAANMWVSLCCSVIFAFGLRSAPLMVYSALMAEFRLVEMFPITYPPNIENVKFDLVPFCCLFFMWSVFVVYSASVYAAVCPLGPIFMLHACGRLEVLKIRVMELFSENTHGFQERENKLKYIIEELQHTYNFVNNIQISFMLFYELVLKGSSVILPVMLYQILDIFRGGEARIEFLVLFFATFYFSGFACYYGDMLAEQGESFRDCLYMCNWETQWDKRARATLIIMQTRAQRPMGIRSVFRQINRDALTDVYRQAYTLFNFLIAAFG